MRWKALRGWRGEVEDEEGTTAGRGRLAGMAGREAEVEVEGTTRAISSSSSESSWSCSSLSLSEEGEGGEGFFATFGAEKMERV